MKTYPINTCNYGSNNDNSNDNNSNDDGSTHLNVGSINIRSIRHKTVYISELLREHSLDILLITETWAHESENNVITASLPKNYKFFHAPRSSDLNITGGGVGIIYRDIFSSTKIREQFHTTDSFETLAYSFYLQNFVLNFAVVYRHGHIGTDALFIEDFNVFLSSFQDLGNNFFICGDFNFWLDFPAGKPFTADFINTLNVHDSINAVNKPTHIHGHTLDLIIHNKDNKLISDISVLPIDRRFTDHALILFKYNQPIKIKAIRKSIVFRNYKNCNFGSLHDDAKNMLSTINHKAPNLDLVSSLNTILSSLSDNHFPLIEKSILVKDSCPWFDSTISRLRNARRKAEREWRRSGTDISRQNYVEARDRVTLEIGNKKQNYYHNKVKSCKGKEKQKNLWNIFNDLMGRQDIVFPTSASPDDVNHYFIQKIRKIRDDLDLNILQNNFSNLVLEFRTVYGSHKISMFRDFSHTEVVNIVKSVNKTFCSSDPFNFSKAPELLSIFTPLMAEIINQSFSTGVFPVSEKSADVKPLLKKASLDREELKNYRPVSHLSFLSKIIEKAIFVQLVPHLENNNRIPKFQSAYREYHSTETALCRIYNDLIENSHNSKPSILLLLDLSSAFDTIDHDLLIQDLNESGVNSLALNLLESYLKNRCQKVSMQSSSESLELHYGVPQGSILGPVLFSLYAAKLENIMKAHGVTYHMYADDTQIYLPVSNLNTSKDKIVSLLSDIKIWMHQRKLKLNEGKTEIILINGGLKSTILAHDFENVNLITDITPSPSVRNLGVFFDSKLTFKEHFNQIIKSCNFHLRRLSSIVKFLDHDSITTLMHAFVTSRVDYCNSLFINLPKKDLKRLQLILNKAARLIFSLPPYARISSHLYELHWLPIKARIEFKISLLTYKALKHNKPVYLRELLKDYSTQSSMSLRVADDPYRLATPFLKNNFSHCSRSFSYMAPRLYNDLPSSIKSAPTTESFKKQLKTYLFNKSYDHLTKCVKENYRT